MYAVRHKDTKLVSYLLDEVTITPTGMVTPEFIATDILPGTHELVEVTPPKVWRGNAWKYDGVWVLLDTAILDELKAAKLQAVQAEKVRARDAGFFVADTLFDSDISARTSYTELGLRLSHNPSFTTQWKASAGQWVTMDAALYAQVMTAGEAHITAVFAWQAAKEVEIGGCQTVEELEAVVTTY